jgi:hypothetical protein
MFNFSNGPGRELSLLLSILAIAVKNRYYPTYKLRKLNLSGSLKVKSTLPMYWVHNLALDVD